MYTIITNILKDKNIVDKTEFTPEEFEQYKAQYELIWEELNAPPAPYVPTPEEIAAQTRAQLEFAVDNFMDSKARAKGFRDRHSFALRAGITGSSWHDQAQVFGAWMDAVNDYCWQVLEDCKAELREVPTVNELLAELPVLEFPTQGA